MFCRTVRTCCCECLNQCYICLTDWETILTYFDCMKYFLGAWFLRGHDCWCWVRNQECCVCVCLCNEQTVRTDKCWLVDDETKFWDNCCYLCSLYKTDYAIWEFTLLLRRRLLTWIINNQSATCSVRGWGSGVLFPGVLRNTMSCGGELLPSHKTNIVIGVKICSEEFGLLFIN